MRNRVKAFVFAFEGIRTFFQDNYHARVHALAAFVVIALGLYVGLTTTEWMAIVLCIGLVLSMEAVNSAIEYLTDLVSPDHHELAKKTKDVAAAAVLISALISVIIAVIIFVPKLL